MTSHDPRRVRMHLESGALVCFNTAHGPESLTAVETDDLYGRTNLTPEQMRRPHGGWRLVLANIRQWLSERRDPILCVELTTTIRFEQHQPRLAR